MKISENLSGRRISIELLAQLTGCQADALERWQPGSPRMAVTADAGRGELHLDGVIASDTTADLYEDWLKIRMISPSRVRAALAEIDGDVTMFINSPGGSVFDASAITAALEDRAARTALHAVVSGLCASAATMLALAGTTRRIAKMGMMMVHPSSASASGDSARMRKTAEVLDKIDDSYAQLIADAAGMAVEAVRSMVAAETWLSAAECVDNGMMEDYYSPSSGDGDGGGAEAAATARSRMIRAIAEYDGLAA